MHWSNASARTRRARRRRLWALAVTLSVAGSAGVVPAQAGAGAAVLHDHWSDGHSSDGLVGDPAFATEPVVLTGADFPDWSSGPEVTARPPQTPTDYGVYDSQGLLAQAGLQSDCYQGKPSSDVNGKTDTYHGDHNCFLGSQAPVRTVLKGVPADTLLGYRWDPSAGKFVQIPFQVDTKWTHYISNNASGFAFYSGADEMLTYTYDTEPFLFTSNPPFDSNNPTDVCQAQPPDGAPVTTPDPNPYLIDSDEMAFMARDAGPRAPLYAALPTGIASAHEVRVTDPGTGKSDFVYVMASQADSTGAPLVVPGYSAANSPYVHYAPDTYSNTFAYAQSNYSDYGNAPKGPVCEVDANGNLEPVIRQGFELAPGDAVTCTGYVPVTCPVVLDPSRFVRRRTLDTATITTPRYSFAYGDPQPARTLAGRWIMDGLQVSKSGDGGCAAPLSCDHPTDYGPSIIDRFKGRAFQQSPGGDTPCCGYEDEQVNWNGSSVTMGVRVGPVRVIRTTWGADSGTNVTRSDIFYSDSIEHEYNLRVHPIPPLDGIYTQWNMDAGAVTNYYNPYNPDGVKVTGINPVRLGDTTDFVGPSGVSESSNDQLGRVIGPVSAGGADKSQCGSEPVLIPAVGNPDDCIYGSFNVADPTFSGPGLATTPLSWEELTGPDGTMVEKWTVDQHSNPSAGGVQSFVEAVPYYVDDSCFDDGTGNSPGPQVDPRNIDPTTWSFTNGPIDPNTGKPTPIAVSPAEPGTYSGPEPVVVTDHYADGTSVTNSYDGTSSYQRRCWNHYAGSPSDPHSGMPYNVPGTATYDPSQPASQPYPSQAPDETQDPLPNPGIGPQGDVRYFEGDIATHGLHLIFTSDSDNADATAPVDEVDVVDGQAVLPPNEPNVGAAYSQQFLVPAATAVTPWPPTSIPIPPSPYIAGSGPPGTPLTPPVDIPSTPVSGPTNGNGSSAGG